MRVAGRGGTRWRQVAPQNALTHPSQGANEPQAEMPLELELQYCKTEQLRRCFFFFPAQPKEYEYKYIYEMKMNNVTFCYDV